MAFTIPLGTKAPAFHLPATDGECYSLADFPEAKALVVFFTCNHCPCSQGSHEAVRRLVDKYGEEGVAFVAINSNSVLTYAEDSFKQMIALMEKEHFPWAYLRDESQRTALAYGALRTPHFYVFDGERTLVYSGCMTDDPTHADSATVNYVDNALADLLAGRPIATPLTNPIGCNVKWEGEHEHWMPPEACDLVL